MRHRRGIGNPKKTDLARTGEMIENEIAPEVAQGIVTETFQEAVPKSDVDPIEIVRQCHIVEEEDGPSSGVGSKDADSSRPVEEGEDALIGTAVHVVMNTSDRRIVIGEIAPGQEVMIAEAEVDPILVVVTDGIAATLAHDPVPESLTENPRLNRSEKRRQKSPFQTSSKSLVRKKKPVCRKRKCSNELKLFCCSRIIWKRKSRNNNARLAKSRNKRKKRKNWKQPLKLHSLKNSRKKPLKNYKLTIA